MTRQIYQSSGVYVYPRFWFVVELNFWIWFWMVSSKVFCASPYIPSRKHENLQWNTEVTFDLDHLSKSTVAEHHSKMGRHIYSSTPVPVGRVYLACFTSSLTCSFWMFTILSSENFPIMIRSNSGSSIYFIDSYHESLPTDIAIFRKGNVVELIIYLL